MERLQALATENGFVTRADALASGLTDKSLSGLVRLGVLVRFRRGSYAFGAEWSGLTEAQKHVTRCRAVLRSLGDGVVLSHTSAALVHGLSVWGQDLARVHVTRLDGCSGGVEADVVHHVGQVHEADVVEVRGMRVVPALRSALETATLRTSEAALVVLDSLLHLRLATPESLFEEFSAIASWPSSRKLHVPVRMADAGSESVGESRARWLFWKHGIPLPRLQHDVRDDHGDLIGTCDFAWPELGLLGEFDGRIKYGRLLRPGQSASDVVFAEKVREDHLRERTGWTMVRLVWADLDHPREVVARIRRLMRLPA